MDILKDKIILFLIIILLVLISAGFAAYRNGLFGQISLNEGGVIIYDIDSATKVFANGNSLNVTKTANGNLVKVPPGRIEIIVAKDNFWPWVKYVNVDAGGLSEIYPFLVPKQAKIDAVMSNDPEYDKIMSLKSAKPPYSASPIISSDATTAIWAEDGTIFAKWLAPTTPPTAFCLEKCQPVINAFHTDQPIRNLLYFKDRNDVILVAVGQFIYALELDRRPFQNFEPVYQGNEPNMFELADGSIYLLDAGLLGELKF